MEAQFAQMILEAVPTIGFPIVLCFAMLYCFVNFFNKIFDKQQKTLDNLGITIRESMSEFTSSMQVMANNIEILHNSRKNHAKKIKRMSEELDKIKYRHEK